MPRNVVEYSIWRPRRIVRLAVKWGRSLPCLRAVVVVAGGGVGLMSYVVGCQSLSLSSSSSSSSSSSFCGSSALMIHTYVPPPVLTRMTMMAMTTMMMVDAVRAYMRACVRACVRA
jgi:predicted Rossmann-fold nucleotide-binding protein